MKVVNIPGQQPLKFPDSMSWDEIEEVMKTQHAISNGPSNAPVAQQNEAPSSGGTQGGILDFLKDTFVKAPKNLAVGASEGLRNLANLPSKIPGLNIAKVPEIDFNKAYGLSPEEESPSAQMIGNLLPAFTPVGDFGLAEQAFSQVPRGAKFLENALTQTAPSSVYSGAQSEEAPGKSTAAAAGTAAPFAILSELAKSGNPILRGAAKIAIASASAYGGAEAAKALGGGTPGELSAAAGSAALPFIFGKALPGNIARNNLAGIDESKINPVLQAADRLGVHLTPGEASGNPYVTAREGNLGRTQEGSKLRYELSENRMGQETSAIKSLLDTIYSDTPEENEKLSSLYEKAYQGDLPENVVNKLKDNSIIKAAIKNVSSNPAYQESLKNVSPGSIKYWDKVKDAIYDMEENAPEKERRILGNTRKDLIQKLDDYSPNQSYRDARQLAERKLTRQKSIEDKINEDKLIGSTFFKKFLENDLTYEKLNNSLRNAPEAQQKLADMRLVFKNLINPSTAKNAAQLAKTSMSRERSSSQSLPRLVDELLTRGRADKNAVKFIYSPEWRNALTNLDKVSDTEKAASIILKNLGKGAGAGVAQLNQSGDNSNGS